METKEFIPALIELRRSSPDNAVRKLYCVFRTITSMGADEVVAAFQTILAIAQELNMVRNPMVLRILEALRVQMIKLLDKELFSRSGLERRFEEVLGFDPRRGRFNVQ